MLWFGSQQQGLGEQSGTGRVNAAIYREVIEERTCYRVYKSFGAKVHLSV